MPSLEAALRRDRQYSRNLRLLAEQLAAEHDKLVLSLADDKQSGAFFCRRITQDRQWRVTYFDADGIEEHYRFSAKADAVLHALKAGYRTVDLSLFRAVSMTDRFHDGNAMREYNAQQKAA